MNLFPTSRKTGAFTLVELLVVIAIIGILAALLLPVLNQSKREAKGIWCENNLQQMAVAFHNFAHDHNNQFPMGVSVNDGGSMEFVRAGYSSGSVFYFSYRNFQTLSNELTSQILTCMTDTRLPATNFAQLQNQNLSYFIGVNSDFLHPNSILVGDRNLTTNLFPTPTILRIGEDSRLRWTAEMHVLKGNVLFADGHVEKWNNKSLAAAANGSVASADLFLPSMPPTNTFSTGAPIVDSRSGSGSSLNSGTSGGVGSTAGGLGNLFSSSNGQNRNPGAIANPSASSSASNYSTSNLRPTPAQMPSRAADKPGQPPLNGVGNNNGMSRNYNAGDANLIYTNGRVPLNSDTRGNGISSPDDSDAAMSPLDQQIVKVLHGTMEWTFPFLLLLLLLYLAYKLRQILRRNEEPRKNDDSPPL